MKFSFFFGFRSFSTSLAVFAAGKEARVMNKLLKVSSKKRSWYLSKDISASSLPYHFQPQKCERKFRRISVLNKLFMKYVSDIMSTGEISSEIAGLRIEISKVKMSPDFGTLNVYWVTKGTSVDSEIESTLAVNAGKLRHELTQLRVIGNVPVIQFVKDRSLSKLSEISSILARADFGDDFEPTDPSLNLLSEFTLSSKLPPEIQEKILSEDGCFDEDPLPPMEMNILGLEHDVIMQKVLRSMNKSFASHRFLRGTEPQNIVTSENGMETLELKDIGIQTSLQGNEVDVTVQNSDLKKFVAKRMALQRKKVPKNYQVEKELLLNEAELNDDDEYFDDYEMPGKNARRLKEMEIDVDDFDDIIVDSDSIFYRRDH